MRKNGYTLIEITILIGLMALSAIIILPKISLAFEDNRDARYDNNLANYLKSAEAYGQINKEEVKKSEEYIITIKDLVDAGYLSCINDDITDPRTGNSMLSFKIKLVYDENNDTVFAEVLS